MLECKAKTRNFKKKKKVYDHINSNFLWVSKRKTRYCLSFNKSMGLDPFNGEALELVHGAISHSKPPVPTKVR